MSSPLASVQRVNKTLLQRSHLQFEGQVQGVGFRPALARLANRFRLTGWVVNTGTTVSAEIQGDPDSVNACLLALRSALPVSARVKRLQRWPVAPVDETGFEIRQAILETGPVPTSAGVMPPADVAPCNDCLSELRDPANRRYRYPFISCAQCGPRDSILLRLPYERSNTTMNAFSLCSSCTAEYRNPADRRFHAQPIACQQCGPQVALHHADGQLASGGETAIEQCIERLIAGDIVAVKGVGGFQLLVDAGNEAAVAQLRLRKQRAHKPFALLAADCAAVAQYAEMSDLEADLLRNAAAPIVILPARRRLSDQTSELAANIAPGSGTLGFMLPASPLHDLLIRSIDFAVVATSANRSGDPMVTDNTQAFELLNGVADAFLVHNREIAIPADDSVLRVVAGRPLFIRRARGYAPTLLPVPGGCGKDDKQFVAVGGHQKVSCAVTSADHVLASPVIGDMDSPAARSVYGRHIERLNVMRPARTTRKFVSDAHPDYFTTRDASVRDKRPIRVPHHLAHIGACMLDNQIDQPVLGIALDGSGYGADGTVRGGECFVVAHGQATRVASLLPFRLPGADRAVTEPRRSAIGLLHTLDRQWATRFAAQPAVASLQPGEVTLIDQMLDGALNSPYTTSVGRLFDAVASLLNLHHQITFQGQAAMAVESMAQEFADSGSSRQSLRTPFTLVKPSALAGVTRIAHHWLDWRGWLSQVFADLQDGADHRSIAFGLHQALAAAILLVAQNTDQQTVVLSGGCFQNRLLTELTVSALRDAGFSVFWHQELPPNDECLAVGQLWWAINGKELEQIS